MVAGPAGIRVAVACRGAQRNAVLANRAEWFGNIRGDVLSGTVVALALIPEAIAFSIIAGVDPEGRALRLVLHRRGHRLRRRPARHDLGRHRRHGAADGRPWSRTTACSTCFAATILTGVLQIVAGCLQLGRVMRFVSRSVMTGFVNALAILIFMAQLPELIGVTLADLRRWSPPAWPSSTCFPRVTRAVPSPLVCIVVLTVVVDRARARRAHRRRHGRAAVVAAGLPASRRPAQPGDAADHPARTRSRWRSSACWNR